MNCNPCELSNWIEIWCKFSIGSFNVVMHGCGSCLLRWRDKHNQKEVECEGTSVRGYHSRLEQWWHEIKAWVTWLSAKAKYINLAKEAHPFLPNLRRFNCTTFSLEILCSSARVHWIYRFLETNKKKQTRKVGRVWVQHLENLVSTNSSLFYQISGTWSFLHSNLSPKSNIFIATSFVIIFNCRAAQSVWTPTGSKNA